MIVRENASAIAHPAKSSTTTLNAAVSRLKFEPAPFFLFQFRVPSFRATQRLRELKLTQPVGRV
jgi:hypothetical protein